MSRRFSPSPYCIACRLRRDACVCEFAPRLQIESRLVLVIHSTEWGGGGNTGHLLRLGVRDASVRIHGRRNRPVNDDGIASASSSTLALFPGRGATALNAEYLAALPRPITLLIPDGNWIQTKNMMKRVPVLRGARPVRLDGPSLLLPCVRHNSDIARRSTFEAVAAALGILESPEIERRLIAFFQRVLETKNHYGLKGPSRVPGAGREIGDDLPLS